MSVIKNIKQKVNILQIAGKLGIEVNSQNKARCFNGKFHKHGDRTPSLQFYPETQSYYCFACSIGGDVIELVKTYQDCSTTEAIKMLEGLI
ncbi:MAG TPA: hypothetical protein DCP51_00360 [Clostridiales bacterium]|nr:MAG: hypothetical protein A2X42_04075 [Candidatus Margulisbacteria bacterium GWF2_38_17]OGI07162.1 MAG: hypothetical protein A2X41_06145 [Candidatus Margulisbacteria bacterium GWE2_39_32]HAN20126.1 hypothetical protein [Clostridiales bacterium]HCT84723.1 hypothetical protein [Candidatus Margulisiibacteriota bacterium]